MKNPFLPNMKALSCQEKKEFSSKQKSKTLNRHGWTIFKPHPQNLVLYMIVKLLKFCSCYLKWLQTLKSQCRVLRLYLEASLTQANTGNGNDEPHGLHYKRWSSKCIQRCSG